jgi:hypothetical protein
VSIDWELYLYAALLVLVLYVTYGPPRIYRAAKRIGLRDKGKTEDDGDGVWVHDPCGTRTRIGIDAGGRAHEYCWRCEQTIDDDDDPDPGETVPEESSGKVVHLRHRPPAA